MTKLPDRKVLNAQAREQLRLARTSPLRMTALLCALLLGMQVLVSAVTQPEPLAVFIGTLAVLAACVLQAGYAVFFMDLRRGQQPGYGVLFDGFSFTGKLIALHLVMGLFVFLWSLLLLIPGIVALYRYRFAVYDLCEDPRMDIMEALRRSCRQTRGWKARLFTLDLRFMGWFMLQGLPVGLLALVDMSVEAVALPSTFLSILPLEGASVEVGLTVLCGLWEMVVALCYRPRYQWMDLAYFDMARAAREEEEPT